MNSADQEHVDVTAIAPLGHQRSLDLFTHEFERNVTLVRDFEASDWSAQTDCADWDVRRLYLHVLGAAESGASFRELVHQLLAARRRQRVHGGPQEAALSFVQVNERLALSPALLIDRLAATAAPTVSRRRRLPAAVRAIRLKVDGPVVERWSLGYLIDVIYLRDAWMHRIDACRATGREPHVTAEHDGRIVAGVVAEWARRHGQPFVLRLTGPAGGRYRSGDDGEALDLDAVEFCRTLAGRETGTGLMATVVPF